MGAIGVAGVLLAIVGLVAALSPLLALEGPALLKAAQWSALLVAPFLVFKFLLGVAR